jgi:2,4-diaminopentanoate dehydrogenase
MQPYMVSMTSSPDEAAAASDHPIGVVHYGLGPIGRAAASVVADRPWLRSVGAVDISPALQGRELGDLLARNSHPSPSISARFQFDENASVALHCTGSSLSRVTPELLELIELGLHVISTTEELSYPWRAHPELAATIDAAARARGVAVIGTGVNPGFAMDYLAVTLSAAAQRVDSVSVHRVQDASTRRLPLQKKIGAGMEVEAFEAELAARRLGHVGLVESVHAVADALDLELTNTTETIEPVIAGEPTHTSEGTIGEGRVIGIHQCATGMSGERVLVDLTLDMAVGIGLAIDRIQLRGLPDLELTVPGGLHGDLATAALLVNTVPRILGASPGLRVMSELPPPTPGRLIRMRSAPRT